MRKAPLIVAGLIFSFAALANLARAIWDIPIKIGNQVTLPGWSGAIAFIVIGLLAIWTFNALRSNEPRT